MDRTLIEAVARLETAGGQKTIKGPNGEDSYNLFNIKEFRPERPGFRAHDRAEGSNDRYRAYQSREESEQDFLSLLERRYPAAWSALQAGNAEAFADGLVAGGYATDPQYRQKLLSVVSSVRRQAPPPSPPTLPEGLVTQDQWRQQVLGAVGQEAAVTATMLRDPDPDSLVRLQDAERARMQEAEGVGFFSATRAALSDSNVMSYRVMDLLMNPVKSEGWTDQEEFFRRRAEVAKTMTPEELEALDEEGVKGPEHFDRAMFHLTESRAAQAVYQDAGMLNTFAGQLTAGMLDIPSWVLAFSTQGLIGGGVKLSRTITGATQGARAAGAGGRAVGLLFAENVGSELALEALNDAAGRASGLEDYAFVTATAGLMTAPFAPFVYRGAQAQANQAALQETAQRIADAAAAQKADLPGVPPAERMRQQADAIRADFTSKVTAEAVVPMELQQQIAEDVGDAPPVAPPAVAADERPPAPALQFPTIIEPGDSPEFPRGVSPVDSVPAIAVQPPAPDLPNPAVPSRTAAMTKLDGQLGSNPGALYLDPATGTKWYVKQPKSQLHGMVEVASMNLYRLMGARVPNVVMTPDGVASQWVDGLASKQGAELANAKGAKDFFVVDAWLANWDVVGLTFDNLLVGPRGAVRIEGGGTMMFRAQGATKPFDAKVSELDTMRDPLIGVEAAQVFGGVTNDDIVRQANELLNVPWAKIEEAVLAAFPGKEAEAYTQVLAPLAERLDYIKQYATRLSKQDDEGAGADAMDLANWEPDPPPVLQPPPKVPTPREKAAENLRLDLAWLRGYIADTTTKGEELKNVVEHLGVLLQDPNLHPDDLPAGFMDDALSVYAQGKTRLVQEGGKHSSVRILGTVDGQPMEVSWASTPDEAKAALVKKYGGNTTPLMELSLRDALQHYVSSTNLSYDLAPHHRKLAELYLARLDAAGDMSLDGATIVVARPKSGARGVARADDGVALVESELMPGKAATVKTPFSTVASKMTPRAHQVFLHEVTHLVTESIIHQWRLNPEGLSLEVRGALAQMESLRQRVVDLGVEPDPSGSGVEYAVTDLSEFLAQAMSDPNTQDFLASMPASSGFGGRLSSAWQELMQHIKALFGMHHKSALEEAAWGLETLLDARSAGGIIDPDGNRTLGWPGSSKKALGPDLPLQYKLHELGALPHQPTDIDTPEFKKWWAGADGNGPDGILQDADGKPLVFYHGTSEQFDAFDPKKLAYPGFFFTPKPSMASSFGSKIFPVYLRANRVWDWRNQGHLEELRAYLQKAAPNDLHDRFGTANPDTIISTSIGKGDWAKIEDELIQGFIKAKGYNGFTTYEGGTWNVALYDPTDVKSIYNRGEWSSKTPVLNMAPPLPGQPAVVNPLAAAEKRRQFAHKMLAHARDFLSRNPIDHDRVKVVTRHIGSVSDGLRLAMSKNPILQMVASLVTETTTGAAGRRATVAVRKNLLEVKITGNGVMDYEAAYSSWKTARNLGSWDDFSKGENRRKFDREVYLEILARKDGAERVTTDPAVGRAADAMEALFTRALHAQKEASVLGAAGLPDNSRGYVPQALDGRKLAEADPADIRALEEHLAQHFESVLHWGGKFSQEFATFYVSRARARAMGMKGYDVPGGPGNADVIRDTLEAMKATQTDPAAIDAAIKALAVVSEKGMGQTKKKLDVGLTERLSTGKLVLDFYDDNVLGLARRYTNRTAGTVALTEFGIQGATGVRYLKEALSEVSDQPHEAPTREELDAFDRVVTELLGQPVHGEVVSRAASNLRLLVGLQRLGSLAFTQAAETMNMVMHLGLGSLLRAVPTLPRLVGEVGRIKRGQDPKNHILTSLEQWGGEFGAYSYKMVMPLDPPDARVGTYAEDPGLISRLTSAGSFIQAKVSFFRGMMAVQHRMTAEQVTMRALRYIRSAEVTGTGVVVRDATAQTALRDMGFDDDLVAHMRMHLDQIAQWDANGNLLSLDITQVPNPRAAEQFVQAVHRGVHQIIQGTFVGERTHWMHNDWMKLLLQLRTFSITAAEKQWGRQRMNHGYARAAGMLLAQTALVLPIHLARVHLASMGREDEEEFREKNLAPQALIRASLNYTSMSGLLGDTLDITTGLLGGWAPEAAEVLGGRQGAQGQGSPLGMIPAAGSIEQAWRAVSGQGSAYQALKQLPFSNLPYLIPIINLTKE